jgi:hypothetical protein
MSGILHCLLKRYFPTFEGKDRWLASAPLSQLLRDIVQDKIMVVCGISVFFFHPRTGTWIRRADSRRDRSGQTMVFHEGEVYAVSTTSNIAAGTVESFNPLSDRWTTRAPLPLPLMRVGSAVVNGKLYCVGGVHSEADYDPLTCSLYVLDRSNVGEAQWRAMQTDLPADLGACHAVAFHGELVVAPHDKHSLFLVDVSGSCACREVDLEHTRGGTIGLVVVGSVLYRLHGAGGHLQITPVEHTAGNSSVALSSPPSSVLADGSINAVAVHGCKIYVFGKSWDAYLVRTGMWASATESSADLPSQQSHRRVPPELNLSGAAVLYPGSTFTWK